MASLVPTCAQIDAQIDARHSSPRRNNTAKAGSKATWARSGEVLAVRLRKGSANTQRGVERFLSELLARVRRAGASGQILIRADSGFWRKATFEQLERAGVLYSIGVRMGGHVPAAIATIAEDAWRALGDYPEPGFAQIAETTVDGRRLIVRRVRDLSDRAQSELFESWRHHAFITNRSEEIALVESEHRAHAVVELAIRDLKAGPLAHFPSGSFAANGAWTQIGVIAHNLARWTQTLGLGAEPSPRTIRTFRRRLIALPGRLTRSGRRTTLHLPVRWPWQVQFIEALERIRALPALA